MGVLWSVYMCVAGGLVWNPTDILSFPGDMWQASLGNGVVWCGVCVVGLWGACV